MEKTFDRLQAAYVAMRTAQYEFEKISEELMRSATHIEYFGGNYDTLKRLRYIGLGVHGAEPYGTNEKSGFTRRIHWGSVANVVVQGEYPHAATRGATLECGYASTPAYQGQIEMARARMK